jgi:GNAT superfamily N-acetyltransferase
MVLLQKPESYTAFLAFGESNDCIGMVTVASSCSIYAGGHFGIIQELYVRPDYRQLQIGHQLIEEVVRYAKGRHWKRIEVGAPEAEKWARTIAFYQREGFVEIGPRLKFVLS